MSLPESHPTSSESRMHRRTLLGAAAAAAVAGVGVGWWRTPPASDAGGVSGAGPVNGFWALEWPTPQGHTLAMQRFQGRPLLVNFWATWCPPCVEELPLINDFYRANKSKGWQVLGLAVDQVQPVQAFLKKMPLEFPVGMAGATGMELTRSLGNLTGGLPFSVVIGSDGNVSHRKLGQLRAEDLAQWAGLK
jgi:thiol-disulfide isomerase/thioredoxin